MKRSTWIAAAAALALGLSACSGDEIRTPDDNGDAPAGQNGEEQEPGGTEDDEGTDETDDAGETGAPGATEGAGYDDPTCEGFFGTPRPLAERADAARDALEAGSVTDEVAYAEVSLLKQRIDDVAAGADGEVAGLLEQVNAPFAEIVSDFGEISEGIEQGEEEGEGEGVPYEELGSYDVADSAAAQDELLAACEG